MYLRLSAHLGLAGSGELETEKRQDETKNTKSEGWTGEPVWLHGFSAFPLSPHLRCEFVSPYLSGDGVELALSVAGEETTLALLLLGDEVELLQLLEDVADDTAGGGGIVRAASAVRLQASVDAGELTHTHSTAEVDAAGDRR